MAQPRGYVRKPLIVRFFDKVNKTNNCWEWSGTNNYRYGLLRTCGKMVRAHRISWEIHFGTIPAGLHVLHKCDNTLCVNPDHLFLGTHFDNMQDMAKKGRWKNKWKR